MKLTDKQTKVVKLMQQGYIGNFALVSNGSAWLSLPNKSGKIKVNVTIFKNLQAKDIVECKMPSFALKQYFLTEKGKSCL